MPEVNDDYVIDAFRARYAERVYYSENFCTNGIHLWRIGQDHPLCLWTAQRQMAFRYVPEEIAALRWVLVGVTLSEAETRITVDPRHPGGISEATERPAQASWRGSTCELVPGGWHIIDDIENCVRVHPTGFVAPPCPVRPRPAPPEWSSSRYAEAARRVRNALRQRAAARTSDILRPRSEYYPAPQLGRVMQPLPLP